MPSKYRDTAPAAPGSLPSPPYETALYMIAEAVKKRRGIGLIYGRLYDNRGGCCAIGAFWQDNPRVSLDPRIIDEVAAYNDSIPATESPKTRWNRVSSWLRWRLRTLAGIVPFVNPEKERAEVVKCMKMVRAKVSTGGTPT